MNYNYYFYGPEDEENYNDQLGYPDDDNYGDEEYEEGY
jgi:hypothetical protein